MEALLIKYGYLVLLFGIAVEGEVVLLAGSYLAHRGIIFSLPLVVLTAIIANSGAGQVYYLLARARGREWLQKRFGDHPRYQKVLNLMARHGNWLLLGSRYAFGFRIIISAACGALDMPPLRFTIINMFASIIWAIPFSLFGFYLSTVGEKLSLNFRRYELWMLLVFLAAAAAVLLVRHLRHAEWIEDVKAADMHTFVPLLVGVMGVINLFEAILPRDPATMRALRTWLSPEVTQGSRPLILFAGIALLQVSRNLVRRKELAWYVAIIALGMSLPLHVARGLDLHHSLISGFLLVYLILNRRRFYSRDDPISIKSAVLMVPVLAAAVFAYGFIGLIHFRQQFNWYPGANPFSETIRSGILTYGSNLVPITMVAGYYLGSLRIAGWLARLYLLALILRPMILRDRMEAPRAKVEGIFALHSQDSLSAFAVQSDKHHLLVAEGRGLIAYATQGSVALTCGDPIVQDKLLVASIGEYLEFCRKSGWTPCFYDAAEVRIPVYQRLALRALKIAEEAVVDLHEFSMSGSKSANLRAMAHKAVKYGMTVRRYSRKMQPDRSIDEQLEEVSEEWLSEKHLGEPGFTLGRFSLEDLAEIPVFLALAGDKLKAFCSWLPYRKGEAAVLDLMRKRTEAAAGTMDLLLSQSLLHLQAEGVVEASLGNAPLANVVGPRGPLERGVALLFENMNAFYGYKNLFQFKQKFAPRWEGRYLVYPQGADLPKVASALAGVHRNRGLLRLLLKS